MLIRALQAAAGNFGVTGYAIDNSLRFNDNDSAYLSRTPATASNRKTFTFSAWVKRGNIGTRQVPFASSNGTAGNTYWAINSDNDTLKIFDTGTGGSKCYCRNHTCISRCFWLVSYYFGCRYNTSNCHLTE
jgi:hypothetical protein